jgi:hypothetical protein
MADNIGYTPGSGATIAADEIGSLLYQRVKVTHGIDGVAHETSDVNPYPIKAMGELIEAIEAMRIAIQSLTRTVGQVQPDTAARMRVVVDAITGSLTLGTVSTVSNISTLATLTNQTQIGGLAATEQIPSLMRLGADSMRRNISVS